MYQILAMPWKDKKTYADREKTCKNIELEIFKCIIILGRKWVWTEGAAKNIWKPHTIHVTFNKWSQNGTIQRIFEELQKQNIIDVQSEVLSLDSISIKVPPDAAGMKKTNGKQSIGRSKEG